MCLGYSNPYSLKLRSDVVGKTPRNLFVGYWVGSSIYPDSEGSTESDLLLVKKMQDFKAKTSSWFCTVTCSCRFIHCNSASINLGCNPSIHTFNWNIQRFCFPRVWNVLLSHINITGSDANLVQSGAKHGTPR